MVSQLTPPVSASPAADRQQVRRRRWTAQAVVVVVVLSLLSIKIINYAAPESIRLSSLGEDVRQAESAVRGWLRNASWLHDCATGTKRTVPGGYVCGAQDDGSTATHIFNSYPIEGGSRAAIYPTIAKAKRSDADAWLRWEVPVPRYEYYRASSTTDWATLNPYPAKYWTFYYYTLRPLIPLIDAYIDTGRQEYLDRLWSVQDSFFKGSETSSLMWSDEHSVAWRGMVLVYEWWKLREYHALTVSQSNLLLAEITRIAEYLLDRNHYQPEMNHGTNEAAALLLIGTAFPDLPNSKDWQRTAATRLSQGLEQLVDSDGVLIENSPYYHMYELEKFWQIQQFAKQERIAVSSAFEPKIRAMIRYATYMLEPDGSVPLLGASLEETYHDSGLYAEMGETDPQFKYVLSQGARGEMPTESSIYLPKAGQTILRSGWGKGEDFNQSSYLTFNVGAYRTLHSQLDSLGVTFYDNGMTLLPPGGLYTYDPGVMHTYFQGTSAHNAVVVDGLSQSRGTAQAGPLKTESGITYQSAYTPVYDGVSNLRTVIMLDKDHYLIVDRLTSTTAHTFDQTWHLFPGAKSSIQGLTVTGTSDRPAARVTISQLDSRGTTLDSVIGQKSPPAGLCSREYDVVVPCQQLAYRQTGTSAAFTTLISSGEPDPTFVASYDSSTGTVVIRKDGRTLRLTLGQTIGHSMSVDTSVTSAPAPVGVPLAGAQPGPQWLGTPASAVSDVAGEPGQRAIAVSAATGSVAATSDRVESDLSNSNLLVRMKVSNYSRISAMSLDLTSNGGRSYTTMALQRLYDRRWDGEWVTLSVARDERQSGLPAHWTYTGEAVNWAHVNGIRLRLSAKLGTGALPLMLVQSITKVPSATQAAVAFVFDDGYESILPAADYMHSYGFAGNVAVIGRATELPNRGYLNVFQLRTLQDQYGWNMANHSQKHLDAVEVYSQRNLGAYEQDILDGASWLESAGLNSAPNWYIYPHGSTNAELATVVGRFYTFARTVYPGAETFPFGSPLRVKTLELHSPMDSADSASMELTPVSHVAAAIQDASKYHHTLIITLHRINSTPSDRPGYPLDNFKQIVDLVHASGIPVKTLSGLDTMQGVTGSNSFTVTPQDPPLITVQVTATQEPTGGVLNWFRHHF